MQIISPAAMIVGSDPDGGGVGESVGSEVLVGVKTGVNVGTADGDEVCV